VGHLVQPPCRSRVTYSRLHRTYTSLHICKLTKLMVMIVIIKDSMKVIVKKFH